MPELFRLAIVVLKLGGTVALGILTGAHLTFSISTIESLISTSSTASILNTLQYHKTRLILPLSILSTTTLISTYLLSPARGRHPYLLMAAAMPAIAFGVDVGIMNQRRLKLSSETDGSIDNKAEEDSQSTHKGNHSGNNSDEEYDVLTKSYGELDFGKKKDNRTPDGDESATPTTSPPAVPLTRKEVEKALVGLCPKGDVNVETYRLAAMMNAGIVGFWLVIGLVGNWGERGFMVYRRWD